MSIILNAAYFPQPHVIHDVPVGFECSIHGLPAGVDGKRKLNTFDQIFKVIHAPLFIPQYLSGVRGLCSAFLCAGKGIVKNLVRNTL